MNFWKCLAYWICVILVMSALLGLIDLALKQVFDGSTLDKVVLILVHGVWFIITFNIITFKYKWTKKFKGLVEKK